MYFIIFKNLLFFFLNNLFNKYIVLYLFPISSSSHHWKEGFYFTTCVHLWGSPCEDLKRILSFKHQDPEKGKTSTRTRECGMWKGRGKRGKLLIWQWIWYNTNLERNNINWKWKEKEGDGKGRGGEEGEVSGEGKQEGKGKGVMNLIYYQSFYNQLWKKLIKYQILRSSSEQELGWEENGEGCRMEEGGE